MPNNQSNTLSTILTTAGWILSVFGGAAWFANRTGDAEIIIPSLLALLIAIVGIVLLAIPNVMQEGFDAYWESFSTVNLILGSFRYIIIVLVLAGSYNTLASDKYTSGQWVNLIAAGLTQGSIYALIALGYTLVYGILLMINFAHGEIFMAGAFTASFLAQWMETQGYLTNPVTAVICIVILLIFSAVISTIVAIILERVAYRPLRGAPRLVPLITAIGASFFLQYTFRGFYGSDFQAYPEFPTLRFTVPLGQFDIPFVQIFVFGSAILLMAILYWLVERTKMGKAMRAVSEDKEVSKLMGIDIDRVIVFTFIVGGALAGAAGVINGLYRPQGVGYTMGFFPGIKAFTAAVLGGIGNVPGAMIGGLLLGVFEAIGPNLILDGLGIPGANQLKDAIAFTMLVLILIFRPQGIMGEKLAEKKA